MNNKVKIVVYSDLCNFINYLVYHSINYSDLIKDNDNYILIVNYFDYKTISRRYKCKIIKYYGIKNIINFFNVHRYMMISLIICLFILNLLTNTIFDINILTEDENLKNELILSLKKHDIDIYKKKKSFKEIEKIKNEILKENSTTLEWMSINEKGCVYEVSVTPKVSESRINLDGIGDIRASKDGVIKHIVVYDGTKVKEVNDYVKEGDVLISGNIYKNDEVISEVKANGEIYGEVWYTVKISVPLEYTEYVSTGKIINHYYIKLFNKEFTLIGKYNSKNVMSEKKLILDKPYLLFILYKEIKKEYEYKTFNISETEAYNEALKRSEKHIKSLLSEDEYIISKNVLKKGLIRSKMYVEVFFKVYENIGVASNTIEKEETNEISVN